MIREFPNENNYKTDLKCRPPWLGDEENVSLQIAKNSHKRYFLYLFILLNNIRFVSYIRRLLLKGIVLKNCKKSFENKFCGIPHICIKGSSLKLCKSNFYLYLQQSSLLQEASRISSIALPNEVSIAIKGSISPPDN